MDLICSERRRVELILLNLMSNAIKFIDEGRVRLTCSRDDEEVSVSVIDTGIGIRSDDLGKLFKPFKQSHTGTSGILTAQGLDFELARSW